MKKSLSYLVPLILASTLLFGCSSEKASEDTTAIEAVQKTERPQVKQKVNQANKQRLLKKRQLRKKRAQRKASNKSSAFAMLKKLKVKTERRESYNRDAFKHWSDLDGNGCDTRQDVLFRENLLANKTSCESRTGRWVSAYDQIVTTNPTDFDIDHLIPLAEAWDSGAYKWTSSRREAFANDMSPYSLIAVTAHSNRVKSDRDPAEWMPTNNGFRCQYIARWISVKARWSLSIDRSEKTALSSYLNSCPKKQLILRKKITIKPKGKSVSNKKKSKKKKKRNNKIPGGKKKASGKNKLDPKFGTCSEAVAKGYGNYKKGRDKEYSWYRDGDSDGWVCEH